MLVSEYLVMLKRVLVRGGRWLGDLQSKVFYDELGTLWLNEIFWFTMLAVLAIKSSRAILSA
ncbi:MAG: hypothetical protein QW699_05565 [Metallosphaera sp.]